MNGKGDDGAISRLSAAARLTRTALSTRLVDVGFYAGQEQIMLALQANEGITPGELATRLGVRPPTIAKAIARLQEQGFVEKRPSGADQRQTHVHLTESGRSALSAIGSAINKTEKRMLSGFDKKDRKRLLRLLRRIEINMTR